MTRFRWWLLCFVSVATAQPSTDAFNRCKDKSCRIAAALQIAEAYLEIDDLEKTQQWLNVAKRENPSGENANAYFIHSLQSEVFYYLGLYEFGVYEAQKGIRCAKQLNDSLLLADGHFFKGINYFEIPDDAKAERELAASNRFYPKKVRKWPRTIINRANIYNNIAQVKFKRKQIDSAIFYNRKAYALAKQFGYARVIANAEQIFGTIYIAQNQIDSARFYLDRSIASALSYKCYDIALLSMGYQMECHQNNPAARDNWFAKGQRLIRDYKINTLYKKYFLEQALSIYRKDSDQARIVKLQQQLLEINSQTDAHKNYYMQHIMDRYMQSENKLLQSKIDDLNQEKNIGALQLIAALLGIAILLAIVFIIRRKNRLQRLLLDQKNEISQDLHDDIGSELSSILINTNLLIKNFDTTHKQQLLLGKIAQTGTEISERLNTFIWSLNTENNQVAHFCEYVHKYGSKLLDGSEITFHFSQIITGIETKPLDGYFRKNLFFCIKETINNAVKHSGATQIKVTVTSPDKKGLQIVISDNGSGAAQESNFGNGLYNIQKRMAALRGSVDFRQQNGLTVVFSVPFRT